MKSVAFLIVDPRSSTPEEHAAWVFLSKQSAFRAKRVPFSVVARQPEIIKTFDIVWWHFDSSTSIPADALASKVTKALTSHIEGGRGLLLSLLASQYVVDLGFEAIRPNVVLKGEWSEESWADGYPDIRGFSSFQGHPIFQNFFGGLYTRPPRSGERFSAAYYEDTVPQSGLVVAVEKLYIKLNESRRNVIEYEIGKGRVLAVGTHFHFADCGQRFRKHLETFASNCLRYLGTQSTPRGERKYAEHRDQRSYWIFARPTVTEFHHISRPINKVDHRLPKVSSGLALHRDFTSSDREEQFYDLSGRRILVMGKERGGIAEVWCHPVRTLRSVMIAFKVGDSLARWSAELNPVVTVKPESLARQYDVDGSTIEEVVFADHSRPGGALNYQIRSKNPVQIFITAHVDLRLMWPLSEYATGSLKFAWDDGLNAAIVSDSTGRLNSLLGSSIVPSERIVGHFGEIVLEGERLVGRDTEQIEVAIGLRVTLTPKANRCAFVFAGSDASLSEALQSYRSIVKRPATSLKRQTDYFRNLQKNATQVITPDEEFNRAFRWAIVGTDRFFVETRSLGTSFVAGYGLSTSGWGGGHTLSGRPGYAWYFGRDSVWTSLAVLDYGDFEKVRRVLDFLGRHQDVSGKILHELTTSRHAHYDAADATPLYLVLLGRYLRATGDRAYVRKEFHRLLKAIDYCFSTDTDGDHLIENTNVGHGWVEGGQLFPVHAEHYLASCWAQALEESAHVAETVGQPRLARRWRRESKTVRRIVREDFWNSETGFYNFAKKDNGSFNEEKTVLPAVGMYFGCAEGDKAQRNLAEYASDNFTSDWGVRIVGKDNAMFKPTGYHYGSIWPLFTGWTSLAEFSYHRPVQGYQHLLSNLLLYDQFSAGCIEEVLHGEQFQPAGVCPHQAWSETMALQPILEGMLGLRVDALNRTIGIRPYIPPHWKSVRVRNIRVGNRRIEMSMKRSEGKTVYTFMLERSKGTSRAGKVALNFQPVFPLSTEIREISIDSRRLGLRFAVNDYQSFLPLLLNLTGYLTVEFHHSGGIAIVPPLPHFQLHGESRGLRIIDEHWRERSYRLTVEGKEGQEYLIDVFDFSCAVKAVEGAAVVSRDGAHLILSALFPGEQATGKYHRKQITLLT